MRLSIHNGRIIDPTGNADYTADILIENGRIVAIAASLEQADTHIDASNCMVCPGLVELGGHVDLGSAATGQNLQSQMLAAGAAGITTLCLLASQSEDESMRLRLGIEQLALVRPLLLAPMSCPNGKLSAMFSLREAGCIGVSDEAAPIKNTHNLKQAMEYALSCDLKLFFHPAEPFLSAGGLASTGETATKMGLKAIPAAAEAIAVGRVLALLEDLPYAAHFCRISNARAVQLIRAAKASGMKVTADVAIPYLYFDETDIDGFDSNYLLSPPLRSKENQIELRNAIADGTITAICANHRPGSKDWPFPLAKVGMESWGMLLPAVLDLAGEHSMPMHKALALVTTEPASILGIKHNDVSEGSAADLCIFDPQAEPMHSPVWRRHRLPGKVVHTICAGKIVHTNEHG